MAEEALPPYVEFTTKAVEDRNASIAAGHYVARDVDFAVVTARGSRDRVEHEITTWFEKIDADVKAFRMPPAWAQQWKDAYAFWKRGETLEEGGTAIKNWPVASPAQVQSLSALRIMSVEQLAAANEEALTRLGLGGRELQQKAKDWLAAAAGPGKQVEELSRLRVELSQAKETIRTQAELIATLKAQVKEYGPERSEATES